MKLVLHVGCGPADISSMPSYFRDGSWQEIRFDIDAAVSPDIVGSILDMGILESGSFDALFSSHNIEHLLPHEVPVALGEFNRVLKGDGVLVVKCPDLESVAEAIVQKGAERLYMFRQRVPLLLWIYCTGTERPWLQVIFTWPTARHLLLRYCRTLCWLLVLLRFLLVEIRFTDCMLLHISKRFRKSRLIVIFSAVFSKLRLSRGLLVWLSR